MTGFFDDFPKYIGGEYGLNSNLNRLNHRYLAIIESNKKIIQGKKILDIASFDGRWSFAALKEGAKHVTGIEILPRAIKRAIKNMNAYQIPQENYNFINGNVEEEILKIDEGSFDMVFCLGFFYHTLNNMKLLADIKRLNPKNIIFDTQISKSTQPIIQIKKEKVDPGGSKEKYYVTRDGQMLVGLPSKSALELLITQIGYSYEFYDWINQGIDNWDELRDYKKGKRVTFTANRL